jgi:hypothetical protein
VRMEDGRIHTEVDVRDIAHAPLRQ